jgi:oligopeptide/dipeptide ABC transporter ATP-binding protein
MGKPLLAIDRLTKVFALRHGLFARRVRLVAVDRVSLTIDEGETLGLVGESGCGKSTLGLTVMRLYEPSAGQIRFAGQDLLRLDARGLRDARRQMQMIFQDPLASLDPRLTVGQIIAEPLDIHAIGTPAERAAAARRLLERVGLSPDSASRFPSEFSGGQQQRIGIARALALQPRLLICDEAVSALDVSVQAQILNLLRDLQAEFGLAFLFISHNIAVTALMSRRIGIMYLGQLVEIGPSQAIVEAPRHPYTQALLAAVPTPDPARRRRRHAVQGDVPSPIERPSGCPFHPRCPLAQTICAVEEPQLRPLAREHEVACHFA